MTRQRVIVVGDVMLDVVVKPSGPIAPTSDTPASVRISRGGSGANLAVALAGTGHDVLFVGSCGGDAAGAIFRDSLADAGVATRLEDHGVATGVVVALVNADAQRAMLTDRGANPLLSEAFVVEQLSESFDHVHVSGYTLLDAATRGAGVAALRAARQAGRSTSVDVCSVGPLAEVTPEVFLAAARESSMLFANEEEAIALTGVETVLESLESLTRHFSEVMITRGASGAVAGKGAIRVECQSQSVEVVDTTGAGDAACGAYLGARLDGESMGVALELAMTASASVVRGLGSRG